MDVKGERLLHVIHHVARALWPPYLKRDPPPTANPTSQEQIRNLNNMVGMQVCQEQPADRAERDSNLCQAKGGAAPAVEE